MRIFGYYINKKIILYIKMVVKGYFINKKWKNGSQKVIYYKKTQNFGTQGLLI